VPIPTSPPTWTGCGATWPGGSPGRLGELADDACDTLGDLLSPAEPAPTRHAAARTILDAGAKLREQAELVERIEALEARPRPAPGLRVA